MTVTVSTGMQAADTIVTDPTDTLSIDGGSLTVGANSTIAGDLNLSSGTLIAASGATLTLEGAANALSGGTMDGSFAGTGSGGVSLANGTLSIGSAGATFNFPAGMFNWSGGAIANGVLDNTGTITLTGNGAKVLESSLVLNNSGTITDNGTNNNWQLNSSSALNNLSGGVIDMNSADEMLDESGTTGSITNQAGALFEATGGSNTVAVPFSNQGGTIDLTVGTLGFTGGGTQTSGTFNASNGATLNVAGLGTWTGTFAGSGGGTIALASGSISIGTAARNIRFPGRLVQLVGGSNPRQWVHQYPCRARKHGHDHADRQRWQDSGKQPGAEQQRYDHR